MIAKAKAQATAAKDNAKAVEAEAYGYEPPTESVAREIGEQIDEVLEGEKNDDNPEEEAEA